MTDLIEACKDSDLLVFVVPHQFVSGVCEQLQGHLKDGVLAVSLIKVLILLFIFFSFVAISRCLCMIMVTFGTE